MIYNILVNKSIFLISSILLLFAYSSGFSAEVRDTKFSMGRGFYSEPFTEIITTETIGAEIVYTLDGSDPRFSKRAMRGTSPLEVTIDPHLKSLERPLTPGVTLRSYAKKSGLSDTDVDTQTYIFISSVMEQGSEMPGVGWASTPTAPTADNENYHTIDYGMDPRIVNDPIWRDSVRSGLLSLPAISIVADLDSIFGKERGFYVNSKSEGRESERPISLELLFPWDSVGFQVNAGVRIRGNYSADYNNPKHSFRVFFRSEYGDSKLKYPLFGGEGVDSFDKIDFRTSQNYSWSLNGSPKYVFARDVFSRDLQRETGQPYSRSRYYHMYINGMYWGLYQTDERTEARYAASYYGGQESDYDVLKSDDYNKFIATDGSTDSYTTLATKMKELNSTEEYFALQGLRADGMVDPQGKKLLDPNNLIDFLLTTYYSGNSDGQPSTLNNLFCFINRENPDGFKYFRHDSEHSMDQGNALIAAQHSTGLSNKEKIVDFLPGGMIGTLIEIEEFKIVFRDRVYRHLFNDGVMTDDSAAALFKGRNAEIAQAVYAESARWGDGAGDDSTLRDYDDWLSAVDGVLSFIDGQNKNVVESLKYRGWYPDSLNPPDVTQNGNIVKSRYVNNQEIITLKINYDGVIYYTVDGSDPRMIGGAVSESAISGDDSVEVAQASQVKARVKKGEEWSALRELFFVHPIFQNEIKITEIHYNPLGMFLKDSLIDGTEFEFVEIKNVTSHEISLTGVSFSTGIIFNFPDGAILAPGAYAVVSNNPKAFIRRYESAPVGDYHGSLSNGGETLTLVNKKGTIIDQVTYGDDAPWPRAADGLGYSVISLDPTEKHCIGDECWIASEQINGSPGEDNIDLDAYLLENKSSSDEILISQTKESSTTNDKYSSEFDEVTDVRTGIIPSSTLLFYSVAHTTGNPISIKAPRGVTQFTLYDVRGAVVGATQLIESDFVHIPGGSVQGLLFIGFK